MAEGGYVILARFHLHEDHTGAFKQAMRDGARCARLEPGVRQFEIMDSAEHAAECILYEEFVSKADWDTHHARPATVELRAKTQPMVASVERTVWRQKEGLVNTEAPPGHSTVVRFRMLPESVEPMCAEIRKDVPASVGMLRFDLNAAEEDPGAFLICARWTSHDAWLTHQSAPHYMAMRERTAAMYATPPDRTLWRPLR